MTPDQVARMDQAGAYLKELASIILGCYQVLVAGGMPLDLASHTAEQLVITSMELGAWRDNV